jgi:hypothetical protein
MIMMLGLCRNASATPTDLINKLLKINSPAQCDLAQDACTQIAEKSCQGAGTLLKSSSETYLNSVGQSSTITAKVDQLFNAHVDLMSGAERDCLSRFFNLNCKKGSSNICKPLITAELRKYFLDQAMGSTLSAKSANTADQTSLFFKSCFTGKDSEKKYQSFISQMDGFKPAVLKTVKDDFVKPADIEKAIKIFSDVKSAIVSRISASVEDALKTRAMVKQVAKVKLIPKGVSDSSPSFANSLKGMCSQYDAAQNGIEVCLGKLLSHHNEFYLAQLFARELSRLIAPDQAASMGFNNVDEYPLSKQMDQCSGLKKSDSKVLKERYDSEKFADRFSADVLSKIVNRKDPKYTAEQMKDGYMNAIQEGCDRGVQTQSLILSSPGIRSDLKCSELKPKDPGYCSFSEYD